MLVLMILAAIPLATKALFMNRAPVEIVSHPIEDLYLSYKDALMFNLTSV